jgi:(p)ppGpp synthase/HD superfamily hydrolase
VLYTPLTKKALRIAFDAHKEQTDKDGLPYIHHPLHLAEQMDTENEIIVALLHDVVEDTDWTFDALEREGFSAIISVLRLLTHEDDRFF